MARRSPLEDIQDIEAIRTAASNETQRQSVGRSDEDARFELPIEADRCGVEVIAEDTDGVALWREDGEKGRRAVLASPVHDVAFVPDVGIGPFPQVDVAHTDGQELRRVRTERERPLRLTLT